MKHTQSPKKSFQISHSEPGTQTRTALGKTSIDSGVEPIFSPSTFIAVGFGVSIDNVVNL